MSFSSKFGVETPSIPQKSEFVNDYRCVGIEIEQEFDNNQPDLTLRSEYWQTKRDHSLRNVGIEYVTKILAPSDVPKAIEQVLPYISRGLDSWRAGIHVHIDARDLSEQELWRLGMLYAILEPLIFMWEGNGRDHSRFCVPWYNASKGVASVMAGIMSDSPRKAGDMLHKYGKYSALNLLPITSFGSVEFRHMQTTTDPARIMKYVMLCHCIVEASKRDINPLLELSTLGAEQFVSDILFGKCDFLKEVNDYEGLLWQGTDTSNLIEVYKDRQAPSRPKGDMRYIEMISNLEQGDIT